MRFIKETNIDDYADRLQATLQSEYDRMYNMLEFCKKYLNDDAQRAGVSEYQARKYELEHVAYILGFDLDKKGE